tara:strand:- start:30727 stop:31710 length:984 start_codon:yes stop_codon:yes gene_type:complete
MAGTSLFKLPHSCSSSDGLQVFEQEDGTVDGYCYSCKTYVPDPLKGQAVEDFPVKKRLKKSKEEIQAEIEEINSYPVDDLRSRMLRKKSLEKYGIKLGYDETDGQTVKFMYFPYTKDGELKSYKVKLLEPKKFWALGDQSDVDLFGWEQAVATGAKRLIIVEGELDVPALDRILEMHTSEKWKDMIPAVASLPHGAASAGKDLARLASKIRRHFKDISFCFDNDKAGRDALEAAMKVFPDATSIDLPCKDANDCILQGKTKAAHKAVTFNASKAKNTRLVWGREVHEIAKVPAQWGVPWPWKRLTELTRGIRTGETYYLGAAQKMGL